MGEDTVVQIRQPGSFGEDSLADILRAGFMGADRVTRVGALAEGAFWAMRASGERRNAPRRPDTPHRASVN